MKAFRADRSGKADELNQAEKTVAIGRDLLPLIEPFRSPDDPPLDAIRKAFEGVEADVKHERDRTAAITKARTDLRQLTDTTIQKVENDLAAAASMAMTRRANHRRGQGEVARTGEVRAIPGRTANPARNGSRNDLFVSPIGRTRRPPPAGVGDEIPLRRFSRARGILYALNEDGGQLLGPSASARISPTRPRSLASIW